MKLTDKAVRALKPGPEPYKVSDGGGLHILVSVAGSRIWRLAYRFNGKQRQIVVGPFPEVSLAEARKKRDDAKRALREGRDPAEKSGAPSLSGAATFEAVAREWFDAKASNLTPRYAQLVWTRIAGDLLPTLGPKPIATLDALTLLVAIRAVEARGALTLSRRVLEYASAIMDFAVATGRAPFNPSSSIRAALRPLPPVKKHIAPKRAELPPLLRAIQRYEGEAVVSRAILFTLFTLVRTSETRGATWDEIDGDLWRIPAERMKMRRDHIVPLSPQALQLLGERPVSGGLVFSVRGRMMSENTMLYALYRMGYHSRATIHGFRSTGSTILNEQGFNRDWVELQLAHVDTSVRGIYNSALYLDGRRKMLRWWADFLGDLGAIEGAEGRAAISSD